MTSSWTCTNPGLQRYHIRVVNKQESLKCLAVSLPCIISFFLAHVLFSLDTPPEGTNYNGWNKKRQCQRLYKVLNTFVPDARLTILGHCIDYGC